MTSRGTFLATACITSVVLAAGFVRGADLQPAVVTNLTGTLRIVQGIPCGGTVDRTTGVTGGRVELTPAEGIPAAGGGRYFSLTRANLEFAPFSATGSCLLIEETRNYGTIRVELARNVSFIATPTPVPSVFHIEIPRTGFLLNYVTTVNGALETGTKVPAENVTGTIDLVAGTVQMRVVLATRATFRAGCTDLFGCVINETHDGSLTANISGEMLFPDADGDGVPDRADNCRFTANPGQTAIATPTITPPAPVTLPSCLSRPFGTAKAADVCDGTAVTITNDAPLQFDRGPNVVIWRAQDAMMRVATATQTVTIADTTLPAFTSVPPSISLSDCGPAALGLPVATDDCAGTPALSNDAPSIFYVGVTPVTWTAADASGNTRTAVQTVTVADSVAPTVTCVATQPTGNSVRVSSFDACLGAPTIRLGSYVLAEGETIHINETGQPGVRLINTVRRGGTRHFQVGKGEAVVSATDASGNVTISSCPVR